MKNLHLLTWLTQLGLSTAVPLVGFVWLSVWLRNRYDLGLWVIFVGVGVGLISAVDGFLRNLKMLDSLSKEQKEPPPVSFGEHD